MLRWLTRLLSALARLLLFGLIAAVLGFAAIAGYRVLRRFVNGDEEDFDDFDDIDAGLDFQETPVEIDVSADDTGTTSGATNQSSTDTARLSTLPDEDEEGGVLTSITGIGPAYEARLQAVGINSIHDLANANAESLSQQIDVIGGQGAIEHWIEQAKSRDAGEPAGEQQASE